MNSINPTKSLNDFSPWGLTKLLKQIDPIMDPVFFALALTAALFKDIFDITIGAIPILGFSLSIVLTPLISIFILLIILLLAGGAITNFFKNLIIFISGGIIDTIPIISFLPTFTILALMLFLLVLKGRKDKAEQKKK